MKNRYKSAAKLTKDLLQFVAGLEKHPEALDKIHDRASTRTIKSWKARIFEFEAARKDLEEKQGELNAEEEEFLLAAGKDLKSLKRGLQYKFVDEPDVLKDFWE